MLRRAFLAARRTSAGACTSSRLSCSSNIDALLWLLLLLLLSLSSMIPMLVAPPFVSSMSMGVVLLAVVVTDGVTVVPAVVAQGGPSDVAAEEVASSWSVSILSGGRLSLEGLEGAVDNQLSIAD